MSKVVKDYQTDSNSVAEKLSWVDEPGQTSKLEFEDTEGMIMVGVFDSEGKLIDSYRKKKS